MAILTRPAVITDTAVANAHTVDATVEIAFSDVTVFAIPTFFAYTGCRVAFGNLGVVSDLALGVRVFSGAVDKIVAAGLLTIRAAKARMTDAGLVVLCVASDDTIGVTRARESAHRHVTVLPLPALLTDADIHRNNLAVLVRSVGTGVLALAIRALSSAFTGGTKTFVTTITLPASRAVTLGIPKGISTAVTTV